MKTRKMMLHIETAVDVDIGKGPGGEVEIEKITCIGLEIDGEFLVISGFTNVAGDSLADIMMERNSQALERLVVEEDKSIDKQLETEAKHITAKYAAVRDL